MTKRYDNFVSHEAFKILFGEFSINVFKVQMWSLPSPDIGLGAT